MRVAVLLDERVDRLHFSVDLLTLHYFLLKFPILRLNFRQRAIGLLIAASEA